MQQPMCQCREDNRMSETKKFPLCCNHRGKIDLKSVFLRFGHVSRIAVHAKSTRTFYHKNEWRTIADFSHVFRVSANEVHYEKSLIRPL